MRTMTRPVRMLATLGTAAALCVSAPFLAGPAAAMTPSSVATVQSLRDVLVGTWVGSYAGFENGRHVSGLERFIITKVRDGNAVGSWQFRASADKPWSAKSPMQLVGLPDAAGGWSITGADANGTYAGRLDATGTKLTLAYQNAGAAPLTYRFLMNKKQ